MTLREYLLKKRYSGYYSWPPTWTTTREGPEDKPRGETGNLEQVLISQEINDVLYLVIRHNGLNYTGAMACADPVFCRQLFAFLKSHIGLSIKQIGDLDFSHTL